MCDGWALFCYFTPPVSVHLTVVFFPAIDVLSMDRFNYRILDSPSECRICSTSVCCCGCVCRRADLIIIFCTTLSESRFDWSSVCCSRCVCRRADLILVFCTTLSECRFDWSSVCCSRCVCRRADLILVFCTTLSESRFDWSSVCCSRCVCRWTGSFFCYLRLPL